MKQKILQNKVFKAIRDLQRLTPSVSFYSENLLPLSKLGEFEIATLFHKILHSKIKSNAIAIRNNKLHDYDTRNSQNLYVHQYEHQSRQGWFPICKGHVITIDSQIPLKIKQTQINSKNQYEGFRILETKLIKTFNYNYNKIKIIY